MIGLIFTYLLTYCGAVAALFNPFVGLLAYVSLSILRPQFLWYWSVPKGNYSLIVGVAVLVGWAIRGFGSWRFGKARAIVGSFIAFFLWSMLSAVTAPNQDVAWNFVVELSKTMLPFLVGMTMIRSKSELYLLVWVVTAATGYLCYYFNMTYYLQGEIVIDGWGDIGRAVMSTMLVMTAFVALFLGLYEAIWWRKALAFASSALQFHAVLLSFSRGGMLGLLTSGLVAFLVVPKKPSSYFVLVVAALIGMRLAGSEVQARFMTISADEKERDASAQSRLDLWRDCIRVIAKHPILGVGPDHWPLVAPEYGWNRGKEAHQNWLQNGAEMGLPAMFFLAATFGMCLIRSWGVLRARNSVPDPLAGMIARMSVAALAGFFVSSQFVTIEMLEPPYYVTLIGAASLKLASIREPASNQHGANHYDPSVDSRAS
jgi:O-antigen ligase